MVENNQKPAGGLRDMIKEAVLQLGPTVSKEQKQEHARLLVKIFEKGMTPKEAMNLSSQELGYLYSYAYSLFGAKKYKEAAELYKLLFILDPTYPDFATALGVCYHQLKDYQNALNAYMTAAVLDPTNPVPLFYAYDCFINVKERASAGIMLCNTIAKCGSDPKYAKIKERAQLLLDNLEKELKDVA